MVAAPSWRQTPSANPATMYPDDDNGAVLSSMAKSGVDLSKSREVEFSSVAPSQSSARAFSMEAATLGFGIEVVAPDSQALADGDSDWDVICKREMVPTYDAISLCGNQLGELASRFDCEYDGWGFQS